MSRNALLLAALASAAFVAACTRPSASMASPPIDWRLVPESTVRNDRRQFFVYGERLDSAVVASDSSVTIERGWVKPDGKVLSLYLTVGPLKADAEDAKAVMDARPGLRHLRIKTGDSVVTLPLKVLDER